DIENTPVCTATPASLDFGTIAPSTTSAEQSFVLNASSLIPSSDLLTVTAPANYQVSLTGTSGWGNFVFVPYTAGSLSSFPVYVEFVGPATTGVYTGSVTVTGGTISPVYVAVTGISANPCTGTPAAGTSIVSPV